MTIKMSTGLLKAIMDTTSFKGAFATAEIKIYGGAIPATADAAESATLLCTVTTNDTGSVLVWEAAAPAGVLLKDSGDVWSGTNSDSGTATHYRLVDQADTGALSTTEKRMQGQIGTSGQDMNFSSVALTNGALQLVEYFSVSLPTL